MAESKSGTACGALQLAPNFLTLLRLALAIPFFYMLTDLPDKANLALMLFFAAGATDVLDGFVARRYGSQSVFGRLMDPATDKILVCGAFVFLVAAPVSVPAWVVVVILARELGVTALRAVAEAQGHPSPGTISGKIKMSVEFTTLCYLVIYAGHLQRLGATWPTIVYWALLILTLLAVVISGAQHVVRSLRLILRTPPARTAP